MTPPELTCVSDETDLQDLLGELLHAATPPVVVDGSRQLVDVGPEIKKLSHTHHAIMDFMVANPNLKMQDIAAHFGYTNSWLSIITHSDTFQRELNTRRIAWRNVHDTRLSSLMLGVAEKAMGVLSEALDDDDITARGANEIAKTALSALGFIGGKKGDEISTVNNTYNISAEDMHLAQQIIQGKARA